MSNSIDPFDIPDMTMTMQVDGPPFIDQPWERFGLFEDELLDAGEPWIKLSGDRQEVTFTCANGWARYRRIRMATISRYIWELCDSAYEARG